MSWMQKLYETYEECAGNSHLSQGAVPLLPVGHGSQQAHIVITLDSKGTFLSAREFDEKTRIILPVTEKSLTGRTSGCAPHPLADKLQYCAKDLPKFVQGGKFYFDQYETQLSAWCASPFANSKVKAVLAYVQKGTLVQDLLDCGVLQDGEGEPQATKWGDIRLKDLFVCWSVEIPGDLTPHTWEDDSVRRSWIQLNATTQEECTPGLCYVLGSKQPLCIKHPTRIRNPADGAKLISSNDTSGFTYRGRFSEADQACGVGYEVSQKAHSALRWLIARQGYRNDTQVFVSWAVSGKPTPPPLEDVPFEWDVPVELDEGEAAPAGLDHTRDVGETFALRLNKYIAGYAAKIDPTECIVVMGLDSVVANQGRMSIIYYRELLGSEFLERLRNWHAEMAWPQRVFAKTKGKGKRMGQPPEWRVCAPTPEAIIEAAYGSKPDAKLKKATVERLVPCIIDGRALPADLVESCVRRAANRAGFKEKEQKKWEQALDVACAMYRGSRARLSKAEQRRFYHMALDEKCTARDYLYGRLLAVAEIIEGKALHLAEEKRPTNAARLMQRFADHPYSAWRNIEMALQPYMQHFPEDWGGFLHNRRALLDDIFHLFERSDFTSDNPLTGEFLLGYHCQRRALKSAAKDKNSVEKTEGAKE